MSQDHVHSLDWVGAQWAVQVQRVGVSSSHQDLVQQVPADRRHKLDGDFKGAVLPAFTWKGDVQVHLQRTNCLPSETEPFGSL